MAVEKRIASGLQPGRKVNKAVAWIKAGGKAMRQLSNDQTDIAEMRRKLQEVVVEFQVNPYLSDAGNR
jgi:hypothetical protein